jgi:tripartite-type tricarboxylate transporter receptor subunit TctC
LGLKEARYEPSKFNWLGRTGAATNVMVVWHTSKVMTFDDLRRQEVTFATTGVGSTITLYPAVTNRLLNTKIKLIMGYNGSAETFLAVARGEVDGTNASWEALKAVHPDWLKEGRLRMLVQHGLSRNSELPDLPASLELVKNPADREALRVILSPAEVGKAYFTTPDVPPVRVTALRRAFDRMVKDPAFVEHVMRIKGEIDPMTGEQMQNLIGELDTMPKALRDRVEALYNAK